MYAQQQTAEIKLGRKLKKLGCGDILSMKQGKNINSSQMSKFRQRGNAYGSIKHISLPVKKKKKAI